MLCQAEPVEADLENQYQNMFRPDSYRVQHDKVLRDALYLLK